MGYSVIPLLSMKFGLNKYARNKQRTTLKYAGDKPCGNFEYQHGREQDDMRLGTLFFFKSLHQVRLASNGGCGSTREDSHNAANRAHERTR